MDQLENRTYLGDGVYAGFDGYQVWLYTQEGNKIALEPFVIRTLVADYKPVNDILKRQGVLPA